MKAAELFEVSKDKIHYVLFIKAREPKTRRTVYRCMGRKGRSGNYTFMFDLYPYQPESKGKKRYTRDDIIDIALSNVEEYLK